RSGGGAPARERRARGRLHHGATARRVDRRALDRDDGARRRPRRPLRGDHRRRIALRRRMRTLASFTLALALALALGTAGGAEREAEAQARCALCGMRVDPESGWRAGGRTARGEVLFDSPKCMFRLHHREGVRDAWVIEYYSQERRP